MDLVGTCRLIEEFVGLGVVYSRCEKSLNSFGTGDFFPDQALKNLSSKLSLMSFALNYKISQGGRTPKITKISNFMKIMISKPPWLPTQGFQAQGRCAAAQCFIHFRIVLPRF